MISKALYKQAADALLSFTQHPHVAAALMAQYATEGRKLYELTDDEGRALLRQAEWLTNRIKGSTHEF